MPVNSLSDAKKNEKDCDIFVNSLSDAKNDEKDFKMLSNDDINKNKT